MNHLIQAGIDTLLVIIILIVVFSPLIFSVQFVEKRWGYKWGAVTMAVWFTLLIFIGFLLR